MSVNYDCANTNKVYNNKCNLDTGVIFLYTHIFQCTKGAHTNEVPIPVCPKVTQNIM